MKLVALVVMVALAFAGKAAAAPFSVEMKNRLITTGEGSANPAYDNKIKNILIFQIGGWSGLPHEQDAGLVDPTWPLHWGKQGYLQRSPDVFMWQMHEVQTLSKNTAIAVLFMPPEENHNSGYGACWEGAWLGRTDCSNGQWKTPQELFQSLKWAAWMKGIQVAPLISINHFEGRPGRSVKEKLEEFVNWYTATIDAVSLVTVEGKIVVLTEGMPQQTNLSEADRSELTAYMRGRSDILWIDNLANANPAAAGVNIYRSAAARDDAQDAVASQWKDRYLWHFLDRYGKTKAEINNPQSKVPEEVRLKWLNISPHDPKRYPVIISQWNEYAEFHVFEPNEWDGYAEFDYLHWRLGQQP